MSPEELATAREKHHKHDCGTPKSCDYVGLCMACMQEWPCDFSKSLAHIDALEAAVAEIHFEPHTTTERHWWSRSGPSSSPSSGATPNRRMLFGERRASPSQRYGGRSMLRPNDDLAAIRRRNDAVLKAEWDDDSEYHPERRCQADLDVATLLAHIDALEAAARDLYLVAKGEHGHDEKHSADWPSCLPVHMTFNRYRDAVRGGS